MVLIGTSLGENRGKLRIKWLQATRLEKKQQRYTKQPADSRKWGNYCHILLRKNSQRWASVYIAQLPFCKKGGGLKGSLITQDGDTA